jgi:hypothetical protein
MTGYFRSKKKNEPKLARYTDQVAGFHSPQGEASAFVIKMFESCKKGNRIVFAFGINAVEKLLQ